VADLAGAVLTGGRSSRMGGVDKALLDWGGEPLVLRPVRALEQAGAEPVVTVGGDLARLGQLGLRAVADGRQGRGPLGGIATAIETAAADVVVVLACDMPGVSPEGIRQVAAAVAGHDVAVPLLDGRPEPLHAAWRATSLPIIEEALGRGEAAVRVVLDRLDAVWLDDFPRDWLRNINFPEDTLGGMSNAQVPEIDVDELGRRHAEGAFVLDVRQPDEYEAGHVPGAVLVPLDQLAGRQDELPKDRPLLVICKSGARSAAAVGALTGAGYDATNVAGGTMAWIDAGRPVVEGPAAG
jgi:molybdopterin-guanine dinucleotide biosynthesis protein A/rhodanese-related sulfurtransferase